MSPCTMVKHGLQPDDDDDITFGLLWMTMHWRALILRRCILIEDCLASCSTLLASYPCFVTLSCGHLVTVATDIVSRAHQP